MRPGWDGLCAILLEPTRKDPIAEATYAGRALDLQPLLVNAKINNDMNLRLQYIAGLGLNSMAFQGIYRTILSYRKFPDGLFAGSTGRIDALHTLLGAHS